jgi:TolB-like protein/DNA-binding winged helix-turn-helix (wHTH) protein/Flp pilus assembly protein TadD
MTDATQVPAVRRFGAFEINVQSGELRKNGMRLRLSGQPFQVLAVLTVRPGELITREELHSKLWTSDTFVDFDHGLNNAVARIREVLEDSSGTPRYIETVPRRGYRFIAPLTDVRPTAVPASDPESLAAVRPLATPPIAASAKHRSSIRTRGLFGTATLIAIVAIGLGLYRVYVLPTKQPPIKSIAVLPLANLSGDSSQDYLADGMTEELIGRLAAIRDLGVISRTSVMQFKNTKKAVPEIARSLGVDAIVEGSVIRDGNRIRVHAQLIRAATDEHIWSESYDREFEDLLVLESEVAQSIAAEVQVTITGQERERLTRMRSGSAEAYEAYLKGRYYWNKRTGESMLKAAVYFQEAIDKDPGFSAAYSGLADCNSGLAWHGFVAPGEGLPKAYAAAQKAIAIDPMSAEAHASLGLAMSHMWNWHDAQSEFQRALQLNDQYANAHHWYGDSLSIVGNHDAAVKEARQALELDPLNLMIGTWVALRYYLARDYDHAITQGRMTVDLDPNFAAAHLVLGESYAQKGMKKESLAELQTAATLSGNSPLYLAQVGVAYAQAGRKSEAGRILADLHKLSAEHYVSPYGIAQIYAALDEEKQTFRWLNAACDDHAVWMTYLGVDPVFDRFRSNPRFQDLLHRVGLN